MAAGGPGEQPEGGIHDYVTGGGGAPLHAVDKPPECITQEVVARDNCLVVKEDGKAVRIEPK